jgi:hypothetical protein
MNFGFFIAFFSHSEEEVMFKKSLFQFTLIFVLLFSSIVSAEKASNPDPTNSATEVSVTTVLSWTSGSGAASHDVYFDTSFDDVNNAIRPAGDVDGNGQVDWADVWVHAEQWLLDPTGLYPCPDLDGDNNVNGLDFAIIADSWKGQTGAAFKGNQTGTTFDPGTLAKNTTYYWRIDEVYDTCPVVLWYGDVWNFTTAAGPAADVEIIGTWVSGTSHTAEAGTNRSLVFTAHVEDDDTDMNLTSVTYGGQSMTKVVEQNVGSGYRAYAVAYILDETGINAASGSDFAVTWAQSPSRSPGFSSVFLQNVNQSVPTGAFDGNGTESSATIATSVLSTSDGDMVIAAGTCGNSGEYTINNGFTEGVEVDIASADAVAGYKSASSVDETPSITHSNVNRQVVIGFVVQAGTADPQPPGQAVNPSPGNGATGVSVDADLSWTAGSGATSHDVYFGTSSPGASQGNQTATTFDTGTMANDMTYYWRIDEVNGQGTTNGVVWSFTTEALPPPPGQASSPNPGNGTTNVSIYANLSWTAGSGSTSSDVYFGTDSTPDSGEFLTNQTATTFNPGAMANDTTYYWRIDEVNAGGTTTGNVWNFTTEQQTQPPEDECDNWQSLHPEWIFCDDFEVDTAFVRDGRYFEYSNNGGDFVALASIGLDSSKGMRVIFQSGEVSAGGFKLGFGRNPNGYMNRDIRESEDFRDIYYRMYLKMQPGWVGSPGKLSRATSFSSATDWSQAMIAHLWSSGDYLLVDPVRCVDPATSLVKCVGYNDFGNMDWLGNLAGVTPIFDSLHDGIWYCIEHHVRLNDPGLSNGIQEFWIDGNLEARRDGMNFVASYTDYAINAILFENYWNPPGSTQLQERYFDNIVVSTQPIGSLD